jgi:hypothetical protein
MKRTGCLAAIMVLTLWSTGAWAQGTESFVGVVKAVTGNDYRCLHSGPKDPRVSQRVDGEDQGGSGRREAGSHGSGRDSRRGSGTNQISGEE